MIILLKILSWYDELFCGILSWCYFLSSPQTFTREIRTWTTVSGQPKLWPLLGFSISIDVDFEDVRLLLVSPLAAGDLTNMSNNDLYNRDQIATFVSAFTLRHIHCPSNSIFTDLGHCSWLEYFAWFRHNSWWPSRSTSLVVIYPSHSFHFRAMSYALKGIVTWSISALPKCPRCLHLLPLQNWSTVVGRHQNWISSRAVSIVIFSRLHAQFTRFLSIYLVYRRHSCICAL